MFGRFEFSVPNLMDTTVISATKLIHVVGCWDFRGGGVEFCARVRILTGGGRGMAPKLHVDTSSSLRRLVAGNREINE